MSFRWRFVAGCVGCLTFWFCAGAPDVWGGQRTSGPVPGTSEAAVLAVVPFANYTGHNEAVSVVMPRLYHMIAESGVAYVSDRDLRPVLRRFRIRSVGMIGREDAQTIREHEGVTFLLVGSLDVYRAEENPEVGLSVRIVDTRDMAIIKASSAAATGEDFAGLFGIGQVSSIYTLTDRVLDRLFEELGPSLVDRTAATGSEPPDIRVALIPFDNASDHAYAGHVVTHVLLSELVRCGYAVLEPGIVNQLLLDERVQARGALDLAFLGALGRKFDATFVVTGTVDRYRPESGGGDGTPPELAYGARLLDAASGRLVMAYEEEIDGAASETLFGMGRRHSIGTLARESTGRLIDRIDEQRKRYAAAIE